METKEKRALTAEERIALIDAELAEMQQGCHAVLDHGAFKPIKTPEFKLVCLSDIQEEAAEWLWYPYIALGKVTIIQGEPGSSKTTMALKIAACVSSGRLFPGELNNPFNIGREPGNVIYQTAEDGLADTIKPRLRTMNPDYKRIFVIDETNDPITMVDDRIRQALEQTKAKLLILDPLTAYVGAKVNINMANEVRAVMNRAVQLADEFNCAVVLIAHMSKMTSAQARNRLIGSIDFVGAARSVLTIGSNPKDKNQKAMAHTKSNLAAFGKTLMYHLDYENGVIVFDEFSELTDDDITAPPRDENRKPSIALETAKDFLKEIMQDGYIKADEAVQIAEARGIKKQTLYDAKAELNIISKRIGFGKNAISWWKYAGYEVPEEK